MASETKVEVKQVKGQEVTDSDLATAAAGGRGCGVDLDLDKLGSGKGGPGLRGSEEQVQKDGTWPPTTPPSGTNAPAQLTIFYGERVFVFDSIPFEKAGEIIGIASAASPGDVKNIGISGPATKPVLSRSPSLQSTATPLASSHNQMYPVNGPSLCKLQAELPIARKHSLKRFFEKRRDRLVNKSPYPTPDGTAKNAESWKPDVCAQASPDTGCFEKSKEPQAA